MDFVRKVSTIIWKDLTSEFRTKETLSSMVIFSFLTVTIFSFAFDPTREMIKGVFPGIIWVAFVFAGILGLNRSFLSERANDCIFGLMLCPTDRSAIYFGKMIGNFIFMSIVELISLPIFFVLFDFRMEGSILYLISVILLATIGFTAIGTFLAALSVNTRNSEILLPIILFPLIIPVLIAAVQATSTILSGGLTAEWLPWLQIIVAFDIIFLFIPALLFEYLLEV